MDYTLHEWVRMVSHHGSIARCAIEKQAEESGLDALAVREKMRHHLRVMQEAAQQGLDERLRSVTGLTGGQAALMMKRLQAGKCLAGNLLGKAEVYALATAECNGCMGKIVAAPTAGACGILPGAVLAMMEEKGATEEQAVDALFVAAAVGQAIATQASISGAEGGCQAECGSAADMALSGIRCPIEPDEVILAMKEVGDALPTSLRETGEGGCAACESICKRLHHKE